MNSAIHEPPGEANQGTMFAAEITQPSCARVTAADVVGIQPVTKLDNLPPSVVR